MLTKGRPGRGGQAGVTLIELLVSMLILGIVTTMLVAGWISLQGAFGTVVQTNDARATVRDAMSRISSELRGSQPTALPDPFITPPPSLEPPVIAAAPMSVTFYSAYNSSAANADGSGVTAVRPTRIRLDTAAQTAPWNPACRSLYLERDMNSNGIFTDSGDRSIELAKNVANWNVADATNGTLYTPVFRYAYRDTDGDVLWTDNAASSLDLASIIAIRARLIIDTKMAGTPRYVDTTTTVRLRNASSD